jgi:hypothetical protein
VTEPIPTSTREIHLPEKDYGLPPIVAAKFRAMSPEWLATILPTEQEQP